eukprot:jgi/Galph1/670/GphlegSOOS_G5405.1
MNSHIPDFYWAQRKDKLFLTIDVPNVDKNTAAIQLKGDGYLDFKARGGELHEQADYELHLELLHPIKAEESKYHITARNVQFVIMKKETGAYWERLLKQPGKNVHCKVDWEHWKDEDSEDEFDFGSAWDSKDMADLDFGSEKESSSDEGWLSRIS